MRIDTYLHLAGYAESRSAAQRLIREGQVTFDGRPIDRPSFLLPEDAVEKKDETSSRLTVGAPLCPYVGRGGLKLDEALAHFSIDVKGRVALDVGASTGGFTDCLISHGARRVYAVDSGHGQLHETLRTDSRVVSMEGFNARYMKKTDFPEDISFSVMDVSFISQTLLHPALADVLTGDAVLISLIKPQFEVGRDGIGRGGIVREPSLHQLAKDTVCASMERLGFQTVGVIPSPILGGDGNREFLACFRRIVH